MHEQLAVFNSDEINSQGYIMPVETLVSALEQRWLTGTPMHRSHDRHRVDGWSRPLGLHLEPGLARLTGLCCRPEEQDEAESLELFTRRYLAQQVVENVEPHLPNLRQELAAFLTGDECPIHIEAAALFSPGLAERAFPAIFAQRDKDGLVPLPSLTAVAPGIYREGNLLLFAHSYLRRSLSRINTLNSPFLEKLHDIASNDELAVRIRLDPDVIGLRSALQVALEFAHWWGPRFSNDLQSIPTGVTWHEADDRQRYFSGIHHTDFWWHEQNDLKTLECEEVLDIPSLGVGRDVWGCRYVHSIVDPKTDLPNHLDGAIRLYDENRMVERLDVDLMHAGRHSDYTKLWRVDGPIALDRWKELITHHFRDNELVGEYLGGIDDSGHELPHLANRTPDPIHRFVPCSMAPGDGVRISIAYHLPDEAEGGEAEVELVPRDTHGSAAERHAYVEADSFEPVKLLRRNGVDVAIPESVMRLAFEDTVINMSLLLHRGPAAVENAARTMEVYRILCDAWVQRRDDRDVSFVVGVNYPDRTVYYSFAGHVDDLRDFLVGFGTTLPVSPDQVGAWSARARAFLTDRFPASNNRPELGRMMRRTGILQFDRLTINPEWYMPFRAEDGARGFHFAIPRSEADLVELWTRGDLSYAESFVVISSMCSSCGGAYVECNCCKYTEAHVGQMVTEAEFAGLSYTNRPASQRRHLIGEVGQ